MAPPPIRPSESVYVPHETCKRIIRDVKSMRKNPLTDSGIYYKHDDENIMKGYAMIIGPSDTVYRGGYYLFEFNYPPDYPASPPGVSFKTNHDNIRFHPNLYVNGKVCISLLNTWTGEQWTSCQTISTILLTLCTLFTNEPLLHEPEITRSNRDFNAYTALIEYKNIEIATTHMLNKLPSMYIPMFDLFYADMVEHFLGNVDTMRTYIQKLVADNNDGEIEEAGRYIQIIQYKIYRVLDYPNLLVEFEKLVCTQLVQLEQRMYLNQLNQLENISDGKVASIESCAN
jgi:ubiquitin-conjugating enzyme E2 Z